MNAVKCVESGERRTTKKKTDQGSVKQFLQRHLTGNSGYSEVGPAGAWFRQAVYRHTGTVLVPGGPVLVSTL